METWLGVRQISESSFAHCREVITARTARKDLLETSPMASWRIVNPAHAHEVKTTTPTLAKSSTVSFVMQNDFFVNLARLSKILSNICLTLLQMN